MFPSKLLTVGQFILRFDFSLPSAVAFFIYRLFLGTLTPKPTPWPASPPITAQTACVGAHWAGLRQRCGTSTS
eukprot:15216-Pelagomonas_calceolata.AAC.2